MIYEEKFLPTIIHHLDSKYISFNRYVFQLFLTELHQHITLVKSLSPITIIQIMTEVIFNKQLVQEDIYKDIKNIQNESAYALLEEIKEELTHRENPMKIILFLLLRSNWFDAYYSVSDFFMIFSDEVSEVLDNESILNTFLSQLDKTHLKRFMTLIKEKKKILYETDNSGEIIFDLLFCNMLIKSGHTVYICGKKEPALNDVTFIEIYNLIHKSYFTHLKEQLNKTFFIIHSNSNTVGKNLFLLSREYLDAYKRCNLVILKGEANFESMPLVNTYHKNIVYLFGVKTVETQHSIRVTLGKEIPTESPFLYIK